MNYDTENPGNTAVLERPSETRRTVPPRIPTPHRPAPVKAKAKPKSFLRQYRIPLGIGAVVMTLFVFGVVKLKSAGGPTPKRQEMVVVSLPPPPPPPQQPPPEPPKIVEQQQAFQPEEQPQDQPPEPPDAPPLGTNIQGDGKGDAFGLNKSGNGRIGGNNSTATKFGYYAGQVQSRVQDAMQRNPKTRAADLRVQVRIWPDKSGRVTRAELAGSTGDPAVDAALRNEVLVGLQLSQPPPDGMPLPIVMRLTARRPR